MAKNMNTIDLKEIMNTPNLGVAKKPFNENGFAEAVLVQNSRACAVRLAGNLASAGIKVETNTYEGKETTQHTLAATLENNEKAEEHLNWIRDELIKGMGLDADAWNVKPTVWGSDDRLVTVYLKNYKGSYTVDMTPKADFKNPAKAKAKFPRGAGVDVFFKPTLTISETHQSISMKIRPTKIVVGEGTEFENKPTGTEARVFKDVVPIGELGVDVD